MNKKDKFEMTKWILEMKGEVNKALSNVSSSMERLFTVSVYLDDMLLSMAMESSESVDGDRYMIDDDELVDEIIEQKPTKEYPKYEKVKPAPPKYTKGQDIEEEEIPEELPPLTPTKPTKQQEPPAPPKLPDQVVTATAQQEKKKGMIERILKRDKTDEEKRRESMIADLEKELESLRIAKKGT